MRGQGEIILHGERLGIGMTAQDEERGSVREERGAGILKKH
jgi:hypothetical protein